MRVSIIRIAGFCLLISTVSLDCSNSEKRNNAGKKSTAKMIAPTAITDTSPAKDTLPSNYFLDSLKWQRNKQTAEQIDNIKRIEVLSANKDIDSSDSENEYVNFCKKSTIDKKIIGLILRNSKPISGEIWHLLYDDLPCNIRGEMKINDLHFKYRVNAGSHIAVWNTDTTFRYGYTGKKFEKYFLSKEWDGKEE
jgi:hypothetical protein